MAAATLPVPSRRPMPPFESLPPDQRAVLQLILTQGRSYDDLSSMLRITPDHVRARAYAGARALAPGAETGARSGRVVDYLLGQLPFSDRLAVRAQLASDPELRAWARALAGELAPVSREPLPPVPGPADGDGPGKPAERATPPRAPAPGPAAPLADETSGDLAAAAAGDGESRRSLLGGALLLAGLAVLVVVLVVALTRG